MPTTSSRSSTAGWRRASSPTRADVDAHIAAFDLARDHDGRYRVNECYCHDTTWQAALAALVDRSDVVLMDLRGFKARNAGCAHELAVLARADAARARRRSRRCRDRPRRRRPARVSGRSGRPLRLGRHAADRSRASQSGAAAALRAASGPCPGARRRRLTMHGQPPARPRRARCCCSPGIASTCPGGCRRAFPRTRSPHAARGDRRGRRALGAGPATSR